MSERIPRAVEKFYTAHEVAVLLGFSERWVFQRAQAGEFTVRDGDQVVAQPVELSGELRVPASGVNWFLAKHPYRYDAGVKARNTAELRRKLAKEAA